MKAAVRISAALAMACALFAGSANAAPPASFAACAACHTSDGRGLLGAERQGSLRTQGRQRRGLHVQHGDEEADLTWDESTLDAFIADPQKAVPGTLMPFSGVADAKQRAEIIEYLKSVK